MLSVAVPMGSGGGGGGAAGPPHGGGPGSGAVPGGAGIGAGGSEECMNESLRNVELPVLPLDANSLTFGDWLVTIEPSAGDWWAATIKGVEEHYAVWLSSEPLQRLRLDPGTSTAATKWPRTERRMTSLLLQAVPEVIRSEAVAVRKLSASHLLFTLFVRFQPGGQSERMNLIRYLTDLKTSGTMAEVASNLRQWRRWWNRAQELAVMLPDPVILAGVLTKTSDYIAKTGAQAAYRLAVCRQQLNIDTRPTTDAIKTFAELLQAESEELAHGVNGAGTTKTAPAVKSMTLTSTTATTTTNGGGGPEAKGGAGEGRRDCRFWLSEKGCRRGDRCKFKHSLLNPKDNRCFHCSGLNHTRKDCPHIVKTKEVNEESTKVAKVKGGDSKPSTPERVGGQNKNKEANDMEPEKQVKEENTTPAGDSGGTTASAELGGLVGQAAALLKSLHSVTLKAINVKSLDMGAGAALGEALGLLDGGATHPLRMALDGEIEKAELVTVELAHGQIQLHQDPTTGTLLSQQPVEPIVPVRGLVDLGYKMTWSRSGCTVEHPRRGKIVSHLRDGCPVVPEKDALLLIHEIEAAERRKYLDIEQEDNLDPEVMSWWEHRFP